MNQTATSGRRKTAVARVFMTPGSGSITVNQKPFEQYFPVPNDRAEVMSPFETTNTIGQYDVVCNVAGGGVAGQAEAVRLGISKGLVAINEELKPALRAKG